MGWRSRVRRRVRQPSKRRALLLAGCSTLLVALALVGFVSAATPHLAVDGDRPATNTLVGLQGYQDEGGAMMVAPNGTVIWEYTAVGNVFDVEALGPHRVQIAGSDERPDSQCPARYATDNVSGCAHNTVRVVDPRTNETRWRYGWYDVERHEHELHDVDHYTVDGADRWVLADMGNDRVFAIDRNGSIQWQWNANATYDRPADMGPEGDWTHMNDVDRLGNRTFQVSLRNFDTVVELRVAPNGSVSVTPVLGPNRYTPTGYVGPLAAQHNPDRLADGHVLVADSEGDRVVEFDQKGNRVWAAGGSARFDWPRDADRLANGNTLVADSYNDRIVEVDANGETVWAVKTGRLPYDADRIPADGAGEGSSDHPTADEPRFDSRLNETGRTVRAATFGVTLAKYGLPMWLVGGPGLLVAGLVSGVAALVEAQRWRRS